MRNESTRQLNNCDSWNIFYPFHSESCGNGHYHHPEKGCDCTKTVEHSKVSKGLIENLYCNTHQVNCSKTGWEMGWFNGTDSRKLWMDCKAENIKQAAIDREIKKKLHEIV